MSKKISIVVPVFNEEGNIEVLAEAILQAIQPLPYQFEIIFIDDGSKDLTIDKLKSLSQKYNSIFYIELSRNFGHQYALKAGLDLANGDAVISMDGDMQHPPYLLPDLIKKWEEGFDIVYTRRMEDKKLPFAKRLTSKAFYKFINYLSEINIEEGTADFRLMDKKVVHVFKNLRENDLFIRGMVSWVGFKSIGMDYKPEARFSGKSKYTFKKMFRLALQGITSFSTKPLYMTIYFGLGITVLAILFFIFYLAFSFYYNQAISGWASLLSTVVFFGGLNLTVLGIIGLYIGKLFLQVKERPTYIIRDTNL